MDLNDIRPASTPTNIPQASPMPQTPKHSYRPIVVSVVVLIALIILGFLFMRAGSRPAAYDDAGNPVYKAPDGKLIEGFPEELLLEQDAVIEESSRIDYNERGENLPYAQYTSRKPYAENINEYRFLLQDQGWTILKDGAWQEMPSTNFYAQRGEAEFVNIALTPKQDGTTKVQIAYSVTTPTN